MDTPTGTIRIAWDMTRAKREGREGIARRQRDRAAAVVAHARSRSPFYRRLYARVAADDVGLTHLAPVTKPQLMAAFDDWVTDPAISETRLRQFVSDPRRVGTWFLGRYFVCSTSGTTGVPGLFLHDRGAVSTYRALSLRLECDWLSGAQWWEMFRRGGRWASVVGTGGHFAGQGWIELERRRDPWRRSSFRVLSIQQPLGALVEALNAFDPAVITSYPSMLELLADEQAAGRLHLRPVFVEMSGESTDEAVRARIGERLATTARNAYASSEFLPLAADCGHGWLHANSDWVVLEPVEADYTPTPPGRPSHTVLMTNLANRVQPIIRYDLGDSVLAKPEPCPCGNPLQAIRVQGRRDDVLRLTGVDGRTVPVPPLTIGSVLDTTPGLRRGQLIQTGSRTVSLKVEPEPGAPLDQVRRRAADALTRLFASLGAAGVEVTLEDQPPVPSPTSGKLRQVLGLSPGS